MTQVDHTRMANAIRGLAMDAVEKAKSGHPGLPMGAADIATVLFTQFLKFDAAEPNWPDRDRFVLSAGHGSMLLYALLYLTGNKDMTLDQIKHFRQLGSLTPGHPENFHTKGIETTTGPLGQGIATAVGMALAEKMLGRRIRQEDRRPSHLCARLRRRPDGGRLAGSDRDGRALEAQQADRAVRRQRHFDRRPDLDRRFGRPGEALQVGRLGGRTDRRPGPEGDRGRDHARAEIQQAVADRLQDHDRLRRADQGRHREGPWRGARRRRTEGRQGKARHFAGAVLGARRRAEGLARGRRRGAAARKEWEARFGELGPRKRAEFERRLRHERPAALAKALRDHKKKLLETPQNVATRKSSEAAIEAIVAAMPMEFVAGSADLTGSNNNKAKSAVAFSAKTPKGRFIHYGIREHGMAAAMNGIFLHGGFAPNGATFLVFTDYARPAMRLAALMGTGVVYVMTHDSIGLGEDGPTHQPVEHLAALRAIPNMRVFRPCDAVEVAECWELALNRIDGPTVLALTRQNLPQLRTSAPNDNPCSHGAYELVAAQGEAKVSLFASGSEVEIAVAAQKQLAERGIASRVVSVPSLELLLAQPADRQKAIIGNAPVKIAIEAAVRWGWDAVIGQDGEFVGMHGFGASAPGQGPFQALRHYRRGCG